ncbi:hypothetical protein fugu_000716, partial [Takifugu bimaculatus]
MLNVLCRSAAAPAPYNAPVFAASAVNVMAAQSVSIDKYPKQEQDQMSGVAALEGDSEDKFIKGTLAEASSPPPPEPQKPMDADKAAIYR